MANFPAPSRPRHCLFHMACSQGKCHFPGSSHTYVSVVHSTGHLRTAFCFLSYTLCLHWVQQTFRSQQYWRKILSPRARLGRFFKSQQSVWQLCRGHVKIAWRRHWFGHSSQRAISKHKTDLLQKHLPRLTMWLQEAQEHLWLPVAVWGDPTVHVEPRS